MKKTTKDKLEKKVAAISDLIVSDESAQKLTEPLSKLVTAIASDEKNDVELAKAEVEKQKIESEERLERERMESQERIEKMKAEAQKDEANKEFASKVFNVTLDYIKVFMGDDGTKRSGRKKGGKA